MAIFSKNVCAKMVFAALTMEPAFAMDIKYAQDWDGTEMRRDGKNGEEIRDERKKDMIPAGKLETRSGSFSAHDYLKETKNPNWRYERVHWLHQPWMKKYFAPQEDRLDQRVTDIGQSQYDEKTDYDLSELNDNQVNQIPTPIIEKTNFSGLEDHEFNNGRSPQMQNVDEDDNDHRVEEYANKPKFEIHPDRILNGVAIYQVTSAFGFAFGYPDTIDAQHKIKISEEKAKKAATNDETTLWKNILLTKCQVRPGAQVWRYKHWLKLAGFLKEQVLSSMSTKKATHVDFDDIDKDDPTTKTFITAYKALDDHRFFWSKYFFGIGKFGTNAGNMAARIELIKNFYNAYADIANKNKAFRPLAANSVLMRWKFFEECVAQVRDEAAAEARKKQQKKDSAKYCHLFGRKILST